MIKKIFTFLIIINLCTIPILAQQSLTTSTSKDSIRTAFDSEQITVATSAIGFTASKINPTVSGRPADQTRASAVTCYNATAQIRVLMFNTPTASVGIIIDIGVTFTIYGYANIAAFKAIRTGGTSATLDCEYYRVQ